MAHPALSSSAFAFISPSPNSLNSVTKEDVYKRQFNFRVQYVKVFSNLLFMTEDLDHLLSLYHFLDIAVYLTQRFLTPSEIEPALFHQHLHYKHHYSQHYYRQKG